MELDKETEQLLIDSVEIQMPFGRYGPGRLPQGVPICDLPYEYLAWFKKKGFPRGRLGAVMEFVWSIKADGGDHLFEPIRRSRGGRTKLRVERQKHWNFD